MKKLNLKAIPAKSVLGGLATVIAIVMGGAEAYDSIRKDRELAQLKKDVAALKGKKS